MVDLKEIELTQNQCFITHVYEVQLATGSELERLNAHLLKEIHAIRAGGEHGIEYPGAGWQTPHDLTQREAFDEVFDAIGEVVRECAGADDIPEAIAPTVTGAWSNIESPGDFVRVHMHPWSVFSGVYYVKSEDNSGDLFLMDPRPGASAVYWPTKAVTERGAINIQPRPGLLVLFPSWLEHYTDPNQSDDERVCISFNTHFAKGEDGLQQWGLV
jgi:uncharacterized protein (TIGR02466 family)